RETATDVDPVCASRDRVVDPVCATRDRVVDPV
ncbi:MAG: hypothetical protein ACI9K3_001225, partial [Halovenus sp.]